MDHEDHDVGNVKVPNDIRNPIRVFSHRIACNIPNIYMFVTNISNLDRTPDNVDHPNVLVARVLNVAIKVV